MNGINYGYERRGTEDDTMFDDPIRCPACLERKPLHNGRGDFKVGVLVDGKCDRCTY